MDKLLIKDLNFIQDMAPELAGTVMLMISMSVDEAYEGLTESEERTKRFLSDLTVSKCVELINFYESALDLMESREMYEECSKIVFILESVKLHKQSLVA